MPSKSKRKGNRYERELVDYFNELPHHAERAWGSDGRALGQTKDTDIMLCLYEKVPVRVQAKRRKSIASYLTANLVDAVADIVCFREDRGESFAVMRLSTLMELLECMHHLDGFTPRD